MMSVLLLTEEDVRQVLTMEMALEAVEDGLRKLALDEATNIPRARTQTDHATQHVMSAAAKSLGVMGYKAYTSSRKGTHFHVAIFDGKTGALQALMQADYLGQMRTGAASGVASEYMARMDASEVGLFGSGKQARTQLIAVCKVRKIRRVQVYSLNEERRRHFADEMSRVCDTEIEHVPRPSARCHALQITGHRHRGYCRGGQGVCQGAGSANRKRNRLVIRLTAACRRNAEGTCLKTWIAFAASSRLTTSCSSQPIRLRVNGSAGPVNAHKNTEDHENDRGPDDRV